MAAMSEAVKLPIRPERIPAGAITSSKIADAAVITAKIADAAVTKAKLKIWQSAETTANGNEQSLTHNLGSVPTLVIVYKTADTRETWAAWSLAEGTHTATAIKITGTSGIKYRVVAMA
jgi:hypothetical protein